MECNDCWHRVVTQQVTGCVHLGVYVYIFECVGDTSSTCIHTLYNSLEAANVICLPYLRRE